MTPRPNFTSFGPPVRTIICDLGGSSPNSSQSSYNYVLGVPTCLVRPEFLLNKNSKAFNTGGSTIASLVPPPEPEEPPNLSHAHLQLWMLGNCVSQSHWNSSPETPTVTLEPVWDIFSEQSSAILSIWMPRLDVTTKKWRIVIAITRPTDPPWERERQKKTRGLQPTSPVMTYKPSTSIFSMAPVGHGTKMPSRWWSIWLWQGKRDQLSFGQTVRK